MLKIHTTGGRTIRIDLADEVQAREWLPELERDSFQAEISGMSVVEHHEVRARCPECGARPSGQIGVQYSVSRPQGLNSVHYEVESIESNGKVKGGERITLYAGDVRLVLMAHQSQPSARVILSKLGRRRFAPRRIPK